MPFIKPQMLKKLFSFECSSSCTFCQISDTFYSLSLIKRQLIFSIYFILFQCSFSVYFMSSFHIYHSFGTALACAIKSAPCGLADEYSSVLTLQQSKSSFCFIKLSTAHLRNSYSKKQ